MSLHAGLATGAKVTIRDEDWIVRKVDASDDGGLCLTCVGLTELTRGTTAQFLTQLDPKITVHRPEETVLCEDKSPSFEHALMYLESQRLRIVPNDETIRRSHLAVMNTAPYQLCRPRKVSAMSRPAC